MIARARPLALLLVLFAPSHPTHAEPIDEVRFTAWGARELSWADARPYFLPRAELLALPIAPPPANSAEKTRADLDELLRLQAARTDEERRAIESHRQLDGVCAALLAAAGRSPRSAPRTLALLHHVDADLTLAVFHAKRQFARARPTQLEPRLHPCIPVPPHAAYPSGHALQGHVLARVLAALAPSHRDALEELGARIGREREIAGLHYASDSAASRALGDLVLARLTANPRFIAELDAARLEWLPR